MGESGVDGRGMLIFMNYREDEITPYMLFFKDGLIEEKVVSTMALQVYVSSLTIM